MPDFLLLGVPVRWGFFARQQPDKKPSPERRVLSGSGCSPCPAPLKRKKIGEAAGHFVRLKRRRR
jgi:hypothetical protein